MIMSSPFALTATVASGWQGHIADGEQKIFACFTDFNFFIFLLSCIKQLLLISMLSSVFALVSDLLKAKTSAVWASLVTFVLRLIAVTFSRLVFEFTNRNLSEARVPNFYLLSVIVIPLTAILTPFLYLVFILICTYALLITLLKAIVLPITDVELSIHEPSLFCFFIFLPDLHLLCSIIMLMVCRRALVVTK